MNVLHLTTSAGRAGGGAYASAYRIHASLRAAGVSSHMLCAIRRVDDESVSELPRTGGPGWRRRLAMRLDNSPLALFKPKPHMAFNNGFLGAFAPERHPLVLNADLLQLYWVTAGFLSVGSLRRLLRLGKPVVWRLSDMWAFTGGCHYPLSCTRYQEHCGSCPELERPHPFDVSRVNFARKRAAYTGASFTVVTPSSFLARACRSSPLLAQARIETILTGIDLQAFSPRPRAEARRRLGLPEHGKVVLFGARGGLKDPRKGGTFALEAARLLSGNQDVHLAVFGSAQPELFPAATSGAQTTNLGLLHDEESLALAYSAADLFLSPCLQDNLPNTVLEAIACGCPVLGFQDAGLDDAVRPGESGALVPQGDAAGLAAMAKTLLEQPGLRESARRLAEREFDQSLQARRYLDLYRELLAPKA